MASSSFWRSSLATKCTVLVTHLHILHMFNTVKGLKNSSWVTTGTFASRVPVTAKASIASQLSLGEAFCKDYIHI